MFWVSDFFMSKANKKSRHPGRALLIGAYFPRGENNPDFLGLSNKIENQVSNIVEMSELVSDFINALREKSKAVKLDNGRELFRGPSGGVWLSDVPSYPKYLGFSAGDVDLTEKFIRVCDTVWTIEGEKVSTHPYAIRMTKIGGKSVLVSKSNHTVLDTTQLRQGCVVLVAPSGHYVVAMSNEHPRDDLRLLDINSEEATGIGDVDVSPYLIGERHIVCDGAIFPLGK
jgi:hypothetical protein